MSSVMVAGSEWHHQFAEVFQQRVFSLYRYVDVQGLFAGKWPANAGSAGAPRSAALRARLTRAAHPARIGVHQIQTANNNRQQVIEIMC